MGGAAAAQRSSSSSTLSSLARPTIVTQSAMPSEADPFPFLAVRPPAALSAPSLSSSSSPPSLVCSSWQCSSPGKSLLTGGYLVLERRYTGLVVALSARFHAILAPCSDQRLLQTIDTPSHPALYASQVGRAAPLPSAPPSRPQPHPSSLSSASHTGSAAEALTAVFILHAPQRSARLVEYWVRLVADGGARGVDGGVTDIRRHPPASEDNPFVLCCLYYTLHFLSAVLPPALLRSKLAHPILLHVRGDHQFYSATPLSDSSDPRRLEGKTGLGSSATLVSSLVGALCHYFQLVLDSDCVGGEDSSTTTQLLLHSALLQPHSSVTAASIVSHGHTAPTIAQPVSSLDSSFTVVGHDLSTFPTSAASLPLCSTLSLPPFARKSICHRLSQLAHCAAQGKVGSGFDVSAAYFGSQVYRRFSPDCIEHVLPQSLSRPLSVDRVALVQCILPEIEHNYHQPADSGGGSEALISSATLFSSAALSAPSSPSSAISPDSTSPSSSYSSLSELDRTPSPLTPPSCSLCSALCSRRQWDEKVTPIKLPSFLCVLLADVQGGAKTPGMVQQVLRWRNTDRASSERLYSSMAAQMAAVEQSLSSLAELDQATSRSASPRQQLNETLARLCSLEADQWSDLLFDPPDSSAASSADTPVRSLLVRALLQLRSSFSDLRSSYRSVGAASGVSIEPDTQTQLCNATSRVKGVVAAGVPGAGGEDAIFVLAVRHDGLTAALDSAWRQISAQRANNGSGAAGNRSVGVLPVEHAAEGVHFRTEHELQIGTLLLPGRQTTGTTAFLPA